MSELKISSAYLPVGAAIVAMAVAWGSSQSAIANVTKETKRVEAIVLEVSKEQAKRQATIHDLSIENLVARIGKSVEVVEAEVVDE